MIEDVIMLLFFLLTGFLASGLGAIPASSSNVAVVASTIESSFAKGFRISLGAAIGSVVLAAIALSFSRAFTNFFEDNPWLQYTMLGILFLIGLLVLLRKFISFNFQNPFSEEWQVSNFWKGFLLALINPQALVFWVLIISVANTYLFTLSKMSPLLNLSLFFFGIFLGKLTTLYYYGKAAKKLDNRNSNKHPIIYNVIGAALVLGSITQCIRLLLH